MNTVWILIWMQFIPNEGISYHHLGTFNNKTLCGGALGEALVLVNDPSETIQCIEVDLR